MPQCIEIRFADMPAYPATRTPTTTLILQPGIRPDTPSRETLSTTAVNVDIDQRLLSALWPLSHLSLSTLAFTLSTLYSVSA